MLQQERSFSEKSDTNYKIDVLNTAYDSVIVVPLNYEKNVSVQQTIYVKMLKLVLGLLLTSSEERFEHLKLKPNFVHMAIGAGLAAAILLTHFRLVRIFDVSALVAISFFNRP